MIKVLTFIIVLLSITQINDDQQFPFQELTIDELIEFEKNHGAELAKLDESYIISFLPNQTYPYSNNYDIGNPYEGKRSINTDSIEARISAYYDNASNKVKYLGYSLSPEAKSIEEIALELHAEGGYDRDEFIKRWDAQWQSEAYQSKIIEAHQKALEIIAEKGVKVKNRNDLDESSLLNLQTYKVNDAIVEIGIVNFEGLNRAVDISIYWK